MRSFLTTVCVIALAWTSAAQAQSTTGAQFDIQLFRLAPGGRGFFRVESGQINPHLGVSAGFSVNYARSPLSVRLVDSSGTTDMGAVVDNRIDTTFAGAIGFFDVAELGIIVPFVWQGGFTGAAFADANVDLGNDPKSVTQGDVRLVPKAKLFSMRDDRLVVAVTGTVALPTAGQADYAGEKGVVFEPLLALSTHWKGFRAGVNLGYRLRTQAASIATLIVDDELLMNVAGGVMLYDSMRTSVELIGEILAQTPAASPFGAGATPAEQPFVSARTPVEIDGGIRLRFMRNFHFTVGVGGGLTSGYGAPSPRVFTSLGYFAAPDALPDFDQDGIPDVDDHCIDRPEDIDGFADDDGCPDPDNDSDLILDEDDLCPNDAEDADNFEDDDGCPDLDNDGDGVPDAVDNCPNEPEDIDGFEDADGCPDDDNDNDQVADAVDQCPLEPEDIDGFEDADGCPDVDNDNDGLPDLNDLCPNHAEDMDNFEDDDGCPEDNDGDGVPDLADRCPNEPETYNGVEDADGCPDKGVSLVRIVEDRIELLGKLRFKRGAAELNRETRKVLDQVASVLRNYEQFRKVRIGGYPDARGTKRAKAALSRRRADQVKHYLVGKGIAAERLEAVAAGPTKPRHKRRLELMIVEKTPLGVDVAAASNEMQVDLPASSPPSAKGLEPVIEIDIAPVQAGDQGPKDGPSAKPTAGEGPKTSEEADPSSTSAATAPVPFDQAKPDDPKLPEVEFDLEF